MSPENGPVSQRYQDRGRFHRGIRGALIGTGVCAFAMAIYAFAEGALDQREETASFIGTAGMVHLGEQSSIPLETNVQVYAAGIAKQTVRLANDSQAYHVGEYLQNVEFELDGYLKLESFVDDQIGFYVLMSDSDGTTDKEFDYGGEDSLKITTHQPVNCAYDYAGNEIELTEDCMRTLNAAGEWRGVEHALYTKGGWFGTNIDDLPPTQSRYSTDAQLDNKRCLLGIRFGMRNQLVLHDTDSDTYMLNTDKANAVTTYHGVKDRLIALLRTQASAMTGLPLSKNNGAPIFITHSQREFLLAVAQANGPIETLSPKEYSEAVDRQLALEIHGEIFDDTQVDIIETYPIVGARLKTLKTRYPEIDIEHILEGANNEWYTEEGESENFPGHLSCLPTGQPELEHLYRDIVMTDMLAGMNTMPSNLMVVSDYTAEPDDDTINNLEYRSGGDAILGDFLPSVLSDQDTDIRIIEHKQNRGLPLNNEEVELLENLGDAA